MDIGELPQGARPEEIRAAEAAMNCTFPDDVRTWFSLHNGHNGHLPDWDLAGLPFVVSTWTTLNDLHTRGIFAEVKSEPTDPIRDDWWHPAWIPFTDGLSGDHLCIDLAPAPGGVVGQVIEWIHDDSRRLVVAPSLTAWFRQLADDLDAGRYEYTDEDYLTRRG